MNTKYQSGRAFENRIRKKLEEDGWWVCRSAGSKGKADLVAIRPGILKEQLDRIWLIQCKSGETRISGKEKSALVALANDLCVTAAVAFKNKKGRVVVAPVTGE